MCSSFFEREGLQVAWFVGFRIPASNLWRWGHVGEWTVTEAVSFCYVRAAGCGGIDGGYDCNRSCRLFREMEFDMTDDLVRRLYITIYT